MSSKKILAVAGVVVLIIIIILAIRLLLLATSLGSYKDYWLQVADKPVPNNAFIYIALGDSAAQGIGASSAENGYVGLITRHLETQTDKEIHVINLSVSGAKISDVLRDQLPKLSELPAPDLVTIEIGANDVLTYDKETFEQEFEELVSTLPKESLTANIPSFARGRLYARAETATEASKIATRLIQQRSDLRFVDIHSATNALGFLDFGADFFHPSDRGYQNWAKAFVSELQLKN